jgi:hypothetical protein
VSVVARLVTAILAVVLVILVLPVLAGPPAGQENQQPAVTVDVSTSAPALVTDPWADLDGSPWDGTLYGGLAPMCEAEDGRVFRRGEVAFGHTCVCYYSAPLNCEWK